MSDYTPDYTTDPDSIYALWDSAADIFSSIDPRVKDFVQSYIIAIVIIVILIVLYILYLSYKPRYNPNCYFPDYPILKLDLETTEGRRRCYDEFTLHSIKRFQFENYVAFRSPWFTATAKRRLFILHMDMTVYNALKDVYFGDIKDGRFVNEDLNKLLELTSVGQLEETLGDFLRDIQEKALIDPKWAFKVE